MNTALLLPWLDLPPGPWPPEDRALLGLPAGPVDSAQAETNALIRMERLRPHQLKHPEVVTEGMNRLAQALIALTSAGEPTAPTANPRKPARNGLPRSETPPTAFPAVDLAPPVSDLPPDLPEPVILEAEVIAEAVAPLPNRSRGASPSPIAEAPPPGLVEVPDLPEPDDRRKAYRRLAYLRTLRRAWLALQPVVAAPSEPLVSAEMVYRAIVGFRDLHLLFRRGRARYRALDASGGGVQSLAVQAHAVMILRELLPGQRQALAMDWATAKASLEAQMVAVRQSLRRPRRHPGLGDAARSFAGKLQRNPEWMLAALTALILLSGAVRTLAR